MSITTEENTKLYKVWASMVNRTTVPGYARFKHWGGSGVTVCKEWLEDYEAFKEWALTNGYQIGLQLDKDILCAEKGITPHIYSPDTCQFVTALVNNRATRLIHSTNKSGYRGVSLVKYSGKWKAQIKVNYKTVYLGAYETALEAARAYDEYVIANNLEHTINLV